MEIRKRAISICLLFTGLILSSIPSYGQAPHIVSYQVDLSKTDITMHWQDDQGRNYANFKRLKAVLNGQGKKLLFAMNGGMFHPNGAPVGLYIEEGKTLGPIDTIQQAPGNFYMQPNGIFYLTKDQKGTVISTRDFQPSSEITFATQSGPMLLINGSIHPRFREASTSLNIRNGVGILPDGNVLFAISKEPVNFHTFANFFLSRGCKNALYLDGAISKAYLPEEQLLAMSGAFGVLIAVTEAN